MPVTLAMRGYLQSNSRSQKEKAELDQWVPIDFIMNWIRQRESKSGIRNRVLVLDSKVGSGKSTALPANLYMNFIHGKGERRGVGITQPTVELAVSIPQDIASSPFYPKGMFRTGETIGWNTKNDKRKPRSYGITFMTVGIVGMQLASMSDDDFIHRYKFVIIDEVHTRSIPQDLTMFALKSMMVRNESNPNLPFLILTSGTLDPHVLLSYFGLPLDTSQPVENSNYIQVTGQGYAREAIWDYPKANYTSVYRLMGDMVKYICTENANDDPDRADILIFLAGAAEMKKMRKVLDEVNAALLKAEVGLFRVLEISSAARQTGSEEYGLMKVSPRDITVNLLGKERKVRRKVLMGTPVIETGLTLDSLKYVIDSGYVKEPVYIPAADTRFLLKRVAQKSRVEQRGARCGRKFDGIVYYAYDRDTYDTFENLQYPEIISADVSEYMLQIVYHQMKNTMTPFDFSRLDLPDSPSYDATVMAMEKLYLLGFLSPVSPPFDKELSTVLASDERPQFGLTKMGHLAVKLNMKPEFARLLLSAYSWGWNVGDAASVVAWLSHPWENYLQDERAKWEVVYGKFTGGDPVSARQLKLLIADEFILGIILVGAIKNLLRDKKIEDCAEELSSWCDLVGLDYRTVVGMLKTRDEVIDQMKQMGMKITGESLPGDLVNTIVKIKHGIYEAFFCNTLLKNGRGDYGIRRSGAEVVVRRKDFDSVKPVTVIYDNLRYDKKVGLVPDRISVMDGFVHPDHTFDS